MDDHARTWAPNGAGQPAHSPQKPTSSAAHPGPLCGHLVVGVGGLNGRRRAKGSPAHGDQHVMDMPSCPRSFIMHPYNL